MILNCLRCSGEVVRGERNNIEVNAASESGELSLSRRLSEQ